VGLVQPWKDTRGGWSRGREGMYLTRFGVLPPLLDSGTVAKGVLAAGHETQT
jgi:hypothetical protein